MSALADDIFAGIVKKLGRRKKQPWQKLAPDTCLWVDSLRDPLWEKIHPVMMKGLNGMKEHGARQPLAMLQELAFEASLRPGAPPHVHTAALWLTDTRMRVEEFKKAPDDLVWLLRRPLERRGILKPRDP